MQNKGPIIELPEVVIYANEEDEPKGQDSVESVKNEGSEALEAAAKTYEYAHFKTPVHEDDPLLEEPSTDINEDEIHYRLYKESDETLQKLATQPTGGDPFNVAVSKVAAEELAKRKNANSNEKAWYRFW